MHKADDALCLCTRCFVHVRNVCFRISFFFSSRRRHTRSLCDWSSDVCSSDLMVLFRQNRVQQLATTSAFSGTYTATACGMPNGPFAAPTGTKTIDVVATSSLPTNDIVLNLLFGSTVVASSDVLTTPEAIHYAPTGGVPVGNYSVQVCPFDANQTPPLTYAGAITINDT